MDGDIDDNDDVVVVVVVDDVHIHLLLKKAKQTISD